MIFPPIFKISFRAIVFWTRPDHSIHFNLTNNMSRQDPYGFINTFSNSCGRDAEGRYFIWYVDRREPQVHEVWNFDGDGVPLEFYPTARVDAGYGFVRESATNYLTEIW